MFDFRDRTVCVTDYWIKTVKFGKGSCHLKSWKLQGSSDGEKWKDLDARDTDVLNGARASEHFVCRNSSDKFRYVRIALTGPNMRGDYALALTNVEFFGSIEEF